NRRPMRRLIANRVFSGLVTAWRFADWPTNRSPDSVKATIEGVVRAPSEFSITFTSLPSMTATQELVVPRSMPMTLLMGRPFYSRSRLAALDPRHRLGIPTCHVRIATRPDRLPWLISEPETHPAG